MLRELCHICYALKHLAIIVDHYGIDATLDVTITLNFTPQLYNCGATQIVIIININQKNINEK